VVRLYQGAYHENQKIKCEVYVLGGDRWRPSPPRGVPFRIAMAAVSAATRIGVKLQPVFADGYLHWLLNPAELSTTQKASVLSFSVTDETFTWVRSPPFPFEFKVSGVHLVELDDNLCMARDLRPHGGTVLEIWKMKAGDWSLDHSINLPQHVGRSLIEPQVIRVLGSVGNCRSRKKIILVTSECKVITYDPRSETTHETSLAIKETHSPYETDKCIPIPRVSLFRERLAPVKKTEDEISLSSPMGMATKEILLRLPGDYAVQCKLVSKQWHGLIESKSFRRSYWLHNNTDMRPKVMLVGKAAGGLGFSFAPLQKFLHQAPNHGTWLETKVVCSRPCHGMNLISTQKEDYLYNPCTGYRRIFPGRFRASHALSNGRTPDGHAFSLGNKIVGLGFNLLRQEHAIVEILYHLKDFTSRQYSLTCSVVQNGSAEDHFEPPLPLCDMPPTYLAGVLYWMSEPRLGQSYKRAIVWFDIALRTFGVIPCPSIISTWNSTSPCQAFVVELEAKLCAVLADPLAEDLEIWKLENGQWERENKLHLKGCSGYSLRENVVVPLAVDPKDGRILLNTGRKLGLYDLVNRSIENLYALDEASSQHLELNNLVNSKILPLVPMLYQESLASYPLVPKGRWLR
jgi:hypothetical protein